jgi:hypothetical protein
VVIGAVEVVVCVTGFSVIGSVLVAFVCSAGCLVFKSLIKDLLCCKERNVKDKQVKKKVTANIEVSLVRKALVFVPNTESNPEKPSTNPPPLPRWIRIIPIKPKQAIACITIITVIIFSPQFAFSILLSQ